MATSADKLALADKHLAKAQLAWDPPDWADLSVWGFYCLEAAVEAAAIHHGISVKKTHWSRVTAAEKLHEGHGLPDVAGLLRDLNDSRKKIAYGDVAAPELDAEDVISAIEGYVDEVHQLIGP